MVIILHLHHFVPFPEENAVDGNLLLPFFRRVQRSLQSSVQFDGTQLAFPARSEHLDIRHGRIAVTGGQAAPAEIDNQVGEIIRIGTRQEKEITGMVGELRHLARHYAVGARDDEALHGLSENFRELHNRHLSRRDEIPQHIARPHAGKLIAVAHHDQAAAERKRPQHGFEKQNIHHGKLVENEGIAIQQILFVPGEGLAIVFVPLHLQEPVDCLGLLARQVAHALGSTACGRGEQHLLPLLLQDADDRLERRRLTGAGAAGEDQQPVFERLTDGILLELCILHASLAFHCLDEAGRARDGMRGEPEHGQNPTGGVYLRLEQARQKEKITAAQLTAHQCAVPRQLLHSLLCQLERHAEHTRGRSSKLVRRDAGVAVVQIVAQHVFHTGPHAPRIILRPFQRGGNGIRLFKGHACLLLADAVRVFPDQLHAGGANHTPHAQRLLRREAIAAQHFHGVPHAVGLPKLFAQLERLRLCDALDHREPFRLLLEHLQRVFAESVHNLRSHGGADPLHRAGR